MGGMKGCWCDFFGLGPWLWEPGWGRFLGDIAAEEGFCFSRHLHVVRPVVKARQRQVQCNHFEI